MHSRGTLGVLKGYSRGRKGTPRVLFGCIQVQSRELREETRFAALLERRPRVTRVTCRPAGGVTTSTRAYPKSTSRVP
jgi:hypothetical protein